MTDQPKRSIYLVKTTTIIYTLVEATGIPEARDSALAGDGVDLLPPGSKHSNDPRILVTDWWDNKEQALNAVRSERQMRPDYDSAAQAREWGDHAAAALRTALYNEAMESTETETETQNGDNANGRSSLPPDQR